MTDIEEQKATYPMEESQKDIENNNEDEEDNGAESQEIDEEIDDAGNVKKSPMI